MASQKELIKTTCPRDCYDRCGIVVIKRDGAITKVAGDPAHPINRGPLCGKCSIAYNGVPSENPIRRRNSRVWPNRGKVGACVMPYDFCP